MLTFLYYTNFAVIILHYISIFEWLLHKYVMHKPKIFRPAYEAHHEVHHFRFKADYTYHLQHERDKRTIPMDWWHGFALTAIASLPWLGLSWLIGDYYIWMISVIMVACYYIVYERIHWCMHLPKSRRLELSWIFQKLNGHHLLHHRYMGSNFNVVYPFADWLFGTLVKRAKMPFMQVRGPGVPDVQPTEV